MNLSDGVKKVLKTKSKTILHNFWKDDLIIIFKEVSEDVFSLGREGKKVFLNFKNANLKTSVSKVLFTGKDVLIIFKVVPQRVKQGFKFFKDDFLEELEKQQDSKQKTKFTLKTIGALVSLSIPQVYQFKKAKKTFSVKNIKNQNAFLQLIFYQVAFKVVQLVTFRFLEALEEELTNESDIKNIRYFKSLITGGNTDLNQLKNFEEPAPGDPSFRILESLKHFIMTGER